MLELIQLVDASLARHGLGVLLPAAPELCHRTPLGASFGSGLLAETHDPKAPNWAFAPIEGQV
jgi:hypothetical protein